jgi:hypothetical protein
MATAPPPAMREARTRTATGSYDQPMPG